MLQNIHILGACRRDHGQKVNIGVRMLLDQENYHSLPDLAKDLQGSGADYLQVAPDCRDDTYPIMEEKDFNEVTARTEELLAGSGTRLLLAGFTQNQKEREYPQKCYAHYFQIALTATGDLVFCKNMRGREEMRIGSIYESCVKEIWEGQRNRELEAGMRPGICGEICKNMQINVAMEQFLNPAYDMSINFIG